MRKIIVAAIAVASLAVPAVSMADAPSTYTWKDAPSNSQGSAIGVDSSQVIQNGQAVKLQAQSPEGRGAIVQATLGH